MSWKRTCCACFVTVSLVGLVTTSSEMLHLEQQPYGPNMCSRTCQRVFGCRYFHYETLHLSCQIGEKANREGVHGIHFNKIQDNLTTNRNLTSLSGAMGIWSRTGRFHYVRYVKRLKTPEATAGNGYLYLKPDLYQACRRFHSLCGDWRYGKAKKLLIKLCDSRVEGSLLSLVFLGGCSVHRVRKGVTILHKASELGFEKVIKCVLSRRSTGLNKGDKYGRSPIMIAAKFGHLKIVKVLIKAGSNLTMVDNFGRTALHWACNGHGLPVVDYIVRDGSIDINSKSDDGYTPIMNAVVAGDFRVFKFLVDYGASTSDVTKDKSNLLHVASFQDDVRFVEYTLDNHIAGIESTDSIGRTPAMTAAIRGSSTVFEFLVRRGCNMDVEDMEGNNMLHCACRGGSPGIVAIVYKKIGRKAKEKRNKRGQTPLENIPRWKRFSINKIFLNT